MRLPLLTLCAFLLAACGERTPPQSLPAGTKPAAAPAATRSPLATARRELAEGPVRKAGVDDPAVISAVATVPRDRFLPKALRDRAYLDRAVRRPDGETLPQPSLTARMIQALELDRHSKVLLCGTRSGYTAALLSRVAGSVFALDARSAATAAAKRLLHRLHFDNVRFRTADPAAGWPDAGPFDAVLVNGSILHIPKPLYEELVPGGRILVPIGGPRDLQSLILCVRGRREPQSTKAILSVRFGPLKR